MSKRRSYRGEGKRARTTTVSAPLTKPTQKFVRPVILSGTKVMVGFTFVPIELAEHVDGAWRLRK
jgi:hypothetical protein